MDQVTHYLNEILDFFREGFAHVNAVLGLIMGIMLWTLIK